MVKIIRGKCRFLKFTIFILTVLILFSFWGCSRQITGASFVQKNNSIDEALTIPTLPFKSSHFKEFNFNGINNYLPLIKKYANEYNLDWALILAVIKQESRFAHTAVSHKGAFGLMQIMPLTQLEIAEKLEFGIEEAHTPRNNIRSGIYHLKSLYSFFKDVKSDDRIRITLAAYNVGIGRILDAQKIAQYMGNDPKNWSSIQVALGFLSKKSYTLHERIWDEGYPPSGYFKNWRSTVDYVESIMKYYESYNLALK